MSRPQQQQHGYIPGTILEQQQQQQQQQEKQATFGFFEALIEGSERDIDHGGEIRQHPTARVNLDPKHFLPGHHFPEAT